MIDRMRALAAFAAVHPAALTDADLGEILHVQRNSIGKRRHELVKAGFVQQAGEGTSRNGRAGELWKATPYGMSEYDKRLAAVRAETRVAAAAKAPEWEQLSIEV
jgi:predicted ArsR family transcriptional regulator